MSRTQVKVCGVRRVGDALHAVSLGASRIGCVLASDSPRQATTNEVRAIRTAIGDDDARLVLVFRQESTDRVLNAANATGVSSVQVHRASESQIVELREHGLHVTPVVSLGSAHAQRAEQTQRERLARAPEDRRSGSPILVDHGDGGSGQRFDPRLLDELSARDLFVAGGLTANNVAALIQAHQPLGVDVSSGLESRPGVKDPMAMSAFFEAVRLAESASEVRR